MSSSVANPYQRPMVSALKIQAGLAAFAMFGLPVEWFVKGCIYSSMGFWIGVIIIRLRRPVPTAGDLWYVRRGLLPVGLLGMFAALCYWEFHAAFIWRR